MSRTSQFPRPLWVWSDAEFGGWWWDCQKCSSGAGIADTCDEANTAARAHWTVCPETDPYFRRIIASYRATAEQAGL